MQARYLHEDECGAANEGWYVVLDEDIVTDPGFPFCTEHEAREWISRREAIEAYYREREANEDGNASLH